MNNLNVFILFSTLIYFKLEENKSGNLKIAVGLVSLYALYNLLKGGVEGWNTYEYHEDRYLENDDCLNGSDYVQGASPPGFPFDHCEKNGKICGRLYSSSTIQSIMGSPPPGEDFPPFQYDSRLQEPENQFL